MNEKRIKNYAKLLISQGLSVQKGQTVIISCPVDCAEFARLCAREAYAAGCREVVMNWGDDILAREKYLNADDSVFDEFPQWRADFYNGYAEKGAAYLSVYSEDPEALSGVSSDRIMRASRASGKAIKFFRDKQTSNAFQWCVASVPNKKWAKKVFPELSVAEATEALWDAILNSARVFGDGEDAVELWKEHSEKLQSRVEKLNNYNFKYLIYKNSLGTDLTVELPEGHFWAGGSENTLGGITFSANIPTEEVFTAPKRDSINGVVFSSRPLIVNGDIADNFSFTIENGRITGISAEKGIELLKTATSVDEGASFFGEVALVPCDSPISKSGILFYNTLFDENASCHFAFGAAYPCVKGAEEKTPEECLELGLNDSITHEDFMIGTNDLSITGVCHDGTEIPVFEKGNFTF